MRRLLGAVRAALGSGRFLSVWSLAATLPLSVSVLAPFGAGADLPSAWPAAVATWLCFVAGLTAVAGAERLAREPARRTAIVVCGILICAALRPVVQDVWTAGSGLPTPALGQLPFRIATNVFAWTVLFATVAVLEGSLRTLRRTNALLRAVAAELSAAQTTARAFDALASRMVRRAADELRGALAALDPEAGSAAQVSHLGAEGFRSWSHALDSLADDTAGRGPSEEPATAAEPITNHDRDPAWRGWRLRLPAAGIVTVVYGASVLPYALRTMTANGLLTGLLLLGIGGASIDAVSRSRILARHSGRMMAFLLLSAAMGGVLSIAAAAGGIAPPVAAVSAVLYPGVAVVAAACAGALHAQRREQRRLSGAIVRAERSAWQDTRPVREGLRRAAALLHRDGQGACTVFALGHPRPAPADITRVQSALGGMLDRLPELLTAAAENEDAAAALTTLTDTWGRVIALRVDTSDAARTVLARSSWLAHDAYELVAEGLLNAVKHGTQRRAEVAIDLCPTGAGPHLRVSVRSFGPLAAGARLRPTSPVRELGARLVAEPGGAVLEAILPVSASAVVSAEHLTERPGSHP